LVEENLTFGVQNGSMQAKYLRFEKRKTRHTQQEEINTQPYAALKYNERRQNNMISAKI
jgi:hypothetical protein